MTTTSLSVNVGDFEENKRALRLFLQAQPAFAGQSFEGDNMDAILSVLSYNTYLNMLYYNMGFNETFLDSAVLRDSAVSRAKELGYTPRSFKSASAVVDISVSSTNTSRASIVIPKGTMFTSRIGDRNYTFTTDRTIVTTESVVDGGTIAFTARNVEIFEGFYVTETVPYQLGQNITIGNEQVDVSSINVIGLEDNGGTNIEYLRANNLFDLSSVVPVFFIQGAAASKYEIAFGDGIFGRAPKKNSLITIAYRISSGELPNGARVFNPGQAIDGEGNITVTTKTPANSGAVFESIESIKFNAPRHFEAQEGAVNASSYSSLLRSNFPEIVDVTAYGGEDAIPPRYGSVIISVVLNGIDYVPEKKRLEYYNFLRARSMMKPVFEDPSYIYAEITSAVKYDVTKTAINPDDVRTLVMNSIKSYSDQYLNHFERTLRFSRLSAFIDNTHQSIINNDLSVRLLQILTPKDWVSGNQVVSFDNPISRVTSSEFLSDGARVVIEDTLDTDTIGGSAAEGQLVLRNVLTREVLRVVGQVDYATGVVTLYGITPASDTQTISIYVEPEGGDVSSGKNTILKIRESDIHLEVVKIR